MGPLRCWPLEQELLANVVEPCTSWLQALGSYSITSRCVTLQLSVPLVLMLCSALVHWLHSLFSPLGFYSGTCLNMSLTLEVFSSTILHWCQNNENDLLLTKQVDYYSFFKSFWSPVVNSSRNPVVRCATWCFLSILAKHAFVAVIMCCLYIRLFFACCKGRGRESACHLNHICLSKALVKFFCFNMGFLLSSVFRSAMRVHSAAAQVWSVLIKLY